MYNNSTQIKESELWEYTVLGPNSRINIGGLLNEACSLTYSGSGMALIELIAHQSTKDNQKNRYS